MRPRPVRTKDIPDPLPPPTAQAGFDVVLRYVGPVVASLACGIPVLLALGAVQHAGTQRSVAQLIDHPAWELPGLALAAIVVAALLLRVTKHATVIRPPREIVWAATLLVVVIVFVGWATGTGRTWAVGDESVNVGAKCFRVATDGVSTAIVLEAPTYDGHRHHFITALTRPDAVERGRRVLRPDAEDRALRTGPLGHVFLLAEGNVCIAACDSVSTRATATAALSPFVLLGARDRGVDADLAQIVKDVHDPAATLARGIALPDDDALAAALESANPWVRDAARRIVEAGGRGLFPEASKKL